MRGGEEKKSLLARHFTRHVVRVVTTMARCFTRRGALPSAALLMYIALMLVSGAASLNPTTVGGRFGQLTNLASAARPDGAPLEKFVVNLDDPPRLRWKNVMLGNKEGALSTMSYLFKSLPDGLHAEVDALMVDAEARFPEWAKEEMLGVADVLNVTFGDVALVNLFFEITPFCTSIVSQSASGRVYHGRNMDFGLAMPTLSENLRDIAVDVEFRKAGETAFVVTTFAGYVGAATGMRPGAFSITANEREMTGPLPIPNIFKSVLNLMYALVTTEAYPVTWAVREVLQDETMSYADAISELSARKFATQMYLTIGGTGVDEGTVLTRGRNELLDVWRMNATAGEWFLVQTNYDHWLVMPPWDNRKKPAEKAMVNVSAQEISPRAMYERVLSLDPVLNELTVYSTVMSCSEGTYESFLRDCKDCSPFR